MQKLSINNTMWRKELMAEKKIEQLQIEVNTWKRFLDFFREENVNLKNRLSNILKNRFDKKLLDEMENFQSKFIKHDELIIFLRKDVAELDKLLMNEKRGEEINGDIIDKKFSNFRINLANSERQFHQLQLDFNCYLSENMQ